MKLKQILAIVACMALVACISVAATVAYLTSVPETVTNSFTAGNVSITLDEALVYTYDEEKTDKDGKIKAGTAKTGDAADRVTKNSYFLFPGSTYDKDPTVHVAANSEDCYIFVKVENNISAIESDETGYTNIATQITSNGWTELKSAEGVTSPAVLYYRKHTKQNTEKDYEVFDKFTIDPDVTNEILDSYDDDNNIKVNVTAYAVQAINVEDETAAWKIVKDMQPGTDGDTNTSAGTGTDAGNGN